MNIHKFATMFIILVFVIMVASFGLYAVIGIKLISNPEVIGEWFGRLISGFNK